MVKKVSKAKINLLFVNKMNSLSTNYYKFPPRVALGWPVGLDYEDSQAGQSMKWMDWMAWHWRTGWVQRTPMGLRVYIKRAVSVKHKSPIIFLKWLLFFFYKMIQLFSGW